MLDKEGRTWPLRKVPLPALICPKCGTSFIPRDVRQQQCSSCAHPPCEVCGAKKRSLGPRCKKCDSLNRIDDGKQGKWNHRETKPIEQVISEVEAFGLLPEKQYAFGYVIGVIFGDGCISRETNHIPHTRSDGTVRYHDSTIYLCRLSVTSRAFAERFARQWEILTGRHAKVSSSIRTNFSKSTLKGRRDTYRMQLFIVDPAHALLGRYLTHLKYESHLSKLLDLPLEVMQGFIHGMIDSEGYVRPEYTDIANKDTELLNTLVIMLAKLGQPAIVYTSPSQSVAHLRTKSTYYKYNIAIDY